MPKSELEKRGDEIDQNFDAVPDAPVPIAPLASVPTTKLQLLASTPPISAAVSSVQSGAALQTIQPIQKVAIPYRTVTETTRPSSAVTTAAASSSTISSFQQPPAQFTVVSDSGRLIFRPMIQSSTVVTSNALRQPRPATYVLDHGAVSSPVGKL